jgi:hypothetical protein
MATRRHLRKIIKFRFHWSSEIYSLGKTYRFWLGLPRFFPLLFTSDHGVGFGSALDSEIIHRRVKSRIHLTFSPTIKNLYAAEKKLRIILVPHPWLAYLATKRLCPQAERSGSIFFPYHTSGGSSVFGFSDEDSIARLRSLPSKYHPITVSLHESDFESDRAKIFQEHFVIKSAGKGFAYNYVDNFLELIHDKKYAFSESWGSQVFYCTYIGIPVQVIPRDISVRDDISGQELVGKSDRAYADEEVRANQIFSDIPTEVTEEQKRFVEYYLGAATENEFLKYKVLYHVFLSLPGWVSKHLIFENLRNLIGEIVRQELKKR